MLLGLKAKFSPVQVNNVSPHCEQSCSEENAEPRNFSCAGCGLAATTEVFAKQNRELDLS